MWLTNDCHYILVLEWGRLAMGKPTTNLFDTKTAQKEKEREKEKKEERMREQLKESVKYKI